MMISMKRKLMTYLEKIKDNPYTVGRDGTIWKEKIARKCRHKWYPISIEPNTAHNYCYLVCLKCCSYTYVETAFVGYYLNSPDLMEAKKVKKVDK